MSDSLYLSQEQARILGVLIEKAITSPDHYPLTPVALLGGCNQKHSRHPVMNISDEEMGTALETLLELNYVTPSGSPVRYKHTVTDSWGLNKAELCLLNLLMLRGPMSSSELLHRSEHLFTFSGVPQIERTLQTMADAEEDPLVLKVKSSTPAGECSWMHTLCLSPGFPRSQPDLMEQIDLNDQQQTNQKMLELEQRVQELEDIVSMLSIDLEEKLEDKNS